MTSGSSQALDALQELTSIRDYILEAQKQLKQGRMPNMAQLEERTATLCAIIQDATSDLQQKCAPELKELARQLDDCEKDLRLFHDKASAEIKHD